MNFPSSKNWKTVFLNEVADVQTGPFGSQLHESDYVEDGTPIITVEHLLNDRINHAEDVPKVSDEDKVRLIKYTLEEGDIVFSRVGSVDRLGRVTSEEDGWMFSGRLLRVRPHRVDSNFLFYALANPVNKAHIRKVAVGATMPSLNTGLLSALSISIPKSSDEQTQIASLLGSFDNKIELLRKQNQTLEATAQTLFKQWFVDFKFPGATGKMVDSELGMIPAGWRVGVVIDIIDRLKISYRCDKKDLNPKGKTPIIDQGINGLYGYTERDPDFEASSKNPVIIFTNHTCNMWFINYPFCAIQNVIPFRGKDGYDDFFIYYMTKNQISFIEYKGHWPDFEYKKYIIPSVDIAKKFSTAIRTNIYKIWNNNEEIQTLSKMRDGLLNKIFSE